MSAAFSIALSALQANSTAIDVVGNNLANLNTTGYKDTDVDFETLMAQSMGVGQNSAQVGSGVGALSTATEYTQGTITTTSGPMDSAIQGDGFFVVQNAANQTLYTRDGSFQVDATGNVVTATGENVQGWTAVNGTVNPNGAVGNLVVPLGSTVPAVPTANMGVTVNLDAQSAVGAVFTAPIQVYDSLGASHTLSVNFTETAANAWSYTVTIPAADLAAGGTTTVANGNLTFDSSGKPSDPGRSAARCDRGSRRRRGGHEHQLEPLQRRRHLADHSVRRGLRCGEHHAGWRRGGPDYQPKSAKRGTAGSQLFQWPANHRRPVRAGVDS